MTIKRLTEKPPHGEQESLFHIQSSNGRTLNIVWLAEYASYESVLDTAKDPDRVIGWKMSQNTKDALESIGEYNGCEMLVRFEHAKRFMRPRFQHILELKPPTWVIMI